nr:hypothetical protein [Pirellula staleyi]
MLKFGNPLGRFVVERMAGYLRGNQPLNLHFHRQRRLLRHLPQSHRAAFAIATLEHNATKTARIT